MSAHAMEQLAHLLDTFVLLLNGEIFEVRQPNPQQTDTHRQFSSQELNRNLRVSSR